MDEPSVTKIIEKVIEIAEENNDENLKRWAHLELGGYRESNEYYTKGDAIPQYREVIGEFRDIYGHTIRVGPELSFINKRKLPEGVAELESFASTSGNLLIFKNPWQIKELREKLGVEASGLVYSPSAIFGILNAIKEEAIKRSGKYISRKKLLTFEEHLKDQKNVMPQQITLSWLFKNIPIGLWWKFCVFLLFVFSLGLYVSGFPEIKKILRYLPLYRAKVKLSEDTAKHIENQLNAVIETHNTTVAKLQEQLLVEERLASNEELSSSQRALHKEAAERIRDTISEENQSFQKKLEALRSILE